MTIATIQDLVGRLGAGGKQIKSAFNKSVLGSPTIYRPHSYWQGAGMPVAGSTPTLGKANGRACTKAIAGSLLPVPANAYYASLEVFQETSNSTQGVFLLVQRHAEVLLSHNEATGAITGCSGTATLPATGGGQIFIETVSGFSAASNTLTLGYTNQDGTAGRTTGSIITTASNSAAKSVTADLFQPLQSGDVGVRSIDSVTLVSGTATGSMLVSLVTVVGIISIGTQGLGYATDALYTRAPFPSINVNACLSFIVIPFAAALGVFAGTVNYVTD